MWGQSANALCAQNRTLPLPHAAEAQSESVVGKEESSSWEGGTAETEDNLYLLPLHRQPMVTNSW